MIKHPREQVAHPAGGRMMTKQSMAAETDINQIMSRWISTGAVPFGHNNQAPRYGDFSSGIDFKTALDQVREAERQFDLLPAHIRKHCDNDPQKFLAMVYDPSRRDELVQLGMVEEQLPAAAVATAGPLVGTDAAGAPPSAPAAAVAAGK